MSVYERRFNVFSGMGSHYTDDPAEALRLMERGQEAHEAGKTRFPPFCDEGYADAEDIYPGHPRYGGIEGTEYIRCTIRRVTMTSLRAMVAERDYQAELVKVKAMIEQMRSVA